MHLILYKKNLIRRWNSKIWDEKGYALVRAFNLCHVIIVGLLFNDFFSNFSLFKNVNNFNLSWELYSQTHVGISIVSFFLICCLCGRWEYINIHYNNSHKLHISQSNLWQENELLLSSYPEQLLLNKGTCSQGLPNVSNYIYNISTPGSDCIDSCGYIFMYNKFLIYFQFTSTTDQLRTP